MLEVIKDPILQNIETIQHGFFTRKGGVSTGYYAGLNCNLTSEDDPANVQENRRRAMAYLGCPLEQLITVNNVHGNTVKVIEKLWLEHQKPDADAMVTKLTGIVLGSDSADCPIVLFSDERASVIGLSHAGWRSARQGILEKTIQQMTTLGARHSNITAVIGPCISQNSYEIGPEFYQQFSNDTLDNQLYFKPSNKQNHFLFDLRSYIKNHLIKLKLQEVSAIEIDTYTDEENFFSYRRTQHKNEPDHGGHLSCISIKK